jgi:hypothetical protein
LHKLAIAELGEGEFVVVETSNQIKAESQPSVSIAIYSFKNAKYFDAVIDKLNYNSLGS